MKDKLMLSYQKFMLMEGIRQGLPHISTMDHEQFGNLIADRPPPDEYQSAEAPPYEPPRPPPP